MGERPTIAFRVSSDQKSDWSDYADENPEYDSLSHLIRISVAHEMSGEYGPVSQGGDQGAGSSQQLGEMQTTVQRMEARLSELGQAVDDMTEVVYTKSFDPENAPSEGELLSALPTGEDNAITGWEIGIECGASGIPTFHYVLNRLDNLVENTAVVKRIDPDIDLHKGYRLNEESSFEIPKARYYRVEE